MKVGTVPENLVERFGEIVCEHLLAGADAVSQNPSYAAVGAGGDEGDPARAVQS